MNFLKRFLGFVLLQFIVISAFSQDCTFYFPTKTGTILETTHYDAKNKVTGSMQQKVLKKTGDSKNMSVDVEVKSFTAKGKQDYVKTVTLKCKNGVFLMDVNSFMPDNLGKGMEGMDIKVDGGDVVIPGNMTVGQKLEDAVFKFSVMNQGMAMMSINIKITNRKVLAIEKVTTSAGTFECYKITQDIETKSIYSAKMRSVDWISKNVGIVKNEIYDQKDKLSGYSLLTALK